MESDGGPSENVVIPPPGRAHGKHIFNRACPGGSLPIINARSVSLKDVTSALASAADGDTVIIPAGIATWTGGLTITKAITLQGSGIGNTIIKDAIRDNTKRLVHFTLVPGKASRLTGIEFQDGGSGGHKMGS